MSQAKPEAKLLVARRAVSMIKSGTVVGLGSGSTASLFIAALGAALRDGVLHDVVGIPTSRESERLAIANGIPVGDFGGYEACDLTVDGADEVTDDRQLIKGLGGALLREKLVAQNSRRLLIIVDESKRVRTLGTKSALPVEVTPFGLAAHERFLGRLGAVPTLRQTADGPFRTDNGNYILDCRFADGIVDPAGLAGELSTRAGIVEHGLFLDMAYAALVAGAQGDVITLGG